MSARLGVLLFDDPATHASGWALEQGGSVFRVASTADLSTECVWLTNLDYPHYSTSGLSRSPRFRGARFLRTNVKALLKEVDLFEASPEARLDYLVNLFAATMRCAGLMGVPIAPPELLSRGFREQVLGRRYGYQGSAQVREALTRAAQPYTFCEAPAWRDEDRVLTIYRNRTVHCADLLSRPIPFGGFSPVDLGELPSPGTELAHYERPLLLRVRIQRFRRPLSELINHGAGAPHLTRRTRHGRVTESNDRQWLSHPEYAVLHRYADLEIDEVLVADAYGRNPFTPPVLNARQKLSPAYGLACESYWSAPVRTLDNRLDTSPTAVWLQSYDRALCLGRALQLRSAWPDAIVQHYGAGRITLRVQDLAHQTAERLYHALTGTDWLTPVMRDQLQPDFPVNAPADATEIQRVLAMRGRIDTMAAMDDALLTGEGAA